MHLFDYWKEALGLLFKIENFKLQQSFAQKSKNCFACAIIFVQNTLSLPFKTKKYFATYCIVNSGFRPVGHGPPMGHRGILQWATERFGLKKSYLHDELFIPLHCQKACRKLRRMASSV